MTISLAQRQNLSYLFFVLCTVVSAFFLYYHINYKWVVFRAAENHFKKKEFASAIPLYLQSVSEGNNKDAVFLRIADSYSANKEFSQAAIWYKKYLASHPNDYNIRLALAGTLTGAGNFEEAEKEYKKLEQQYETAP